MSDPSLFLKTILIIIGLFLLIITVRSLSRRGMTETFSLLWGLVSLAFILAGVLLHPTMWHYYISFAGLILFLVLIICGLYAAYFVSIKISELVRKNHELAIQVSLLNQENERILKRLSELTGLNEKDL